MIYFANGGFNWQDLYYMPIKLREFYWRELLKVKDSEKQSYDKVNRKNNTSKTSRK